jgi:glucoamylase
MMAIVQQPRRALGAPGISPRWTRGTKDAIGTAYSGSSRVWYTVSAGILNEVYYPTVDHPQIRDLQYLVTDGHSFFHDERRHLESRLEPFGGHALGVRIINSDREGRYRIIKEIIADPHQPCVLVHTRLEANRKGLSKLRLFALLAPHLDVGGWENNAYTAEVAGHALLTAEKHGTWLAMGATIPFLHRSCGYVGTTDGWTDLADNFRMDWEFDVAEDGNVALLGELDLDVAHEFTLGLSFGTSSHHATSTLLQSLGVPFAEHRALFIEQWGRACPRAAALESVTNDSGALYKASHALLFAHEDKSYLGAIIASLSIPWGESRSDEDLGGYHLVWTRDLVNSATALLASGTTDTPLRALIYLACSQQTDGGFPQNFWVDGEPCQSSIQLDEVAFPILLAWKLREAGALREFDPYSMVLRGAGYLVEHGPVTTQERWEENSGYSPSTLASNISALTCAAGFARERNDESTAVVLQGYADFLECHVEAWTVTTDGTLVPGIARHFIRIHPVDPNDPEPDEDPNGGLLTIRNRPPAEPTEFLAKEIIDAGFLELVRYGIRGAGGELFEDSLRVVDAKLKVDTPFGPCWRRYNHDGYGQRDDGSSFVGWGKGRAWPLLTGERGHYELAAGREVGSYIRAMEGFATAGGLLPEQVWDASDLPKARMRLGRPTGAAMPLMWAHAEYIKLLRSMHDGQVFDRVPAVVERYQHSRRHLPIEIWTFRRRVRSVHPGMLLRLHARASFRLHWTNAEWSGATDTPSTPTALGIDFVDIPISPTQVAPIRFTFFWREAARWEGRDFEVAMKGTV